MKQDKWTNGGLQQIGLGVKKHKEAWDFYRTHFGFDIPMFDETGTADIMAPYMGGQSWERHAVFAVNINGGGGMEIWQFTNRIAIGLSQELSLGHTGILAAFFRCKNIYKIRERLLQSNLEVSRLCYAPDGTLRCFVRDLEYNWICLVETNDGWFAKPKKRNFQDAHYGGVCGALIGVSNMDISIEFYQTICGYDTIVYDKVEVFEDFDILNEQQQVRRVGLRRSTLNKGTFAPLLTDSFIELVEAKEQRYTHLYKDRYWGDIGFIHLCFDIKEMDSFKTHCVDHGYPFSIDTGAEFSMDDASGRFSYLEDPDGTLIEFVEVYKLPLLKKYGIVLNIKKRGMDKPLPKILLKALKTRRIK